ncbi:MAG: hypothetical protein IPJ85_17505 [Flavobacteriales bacterium]|nr:hypothetical protein [Flavobacteriales bacterium]
MILRSDEHGRYQRDIIPLDAIEPASLNINPDADAVVVPCGAKHGACCESERFRDAIMRKTSRITIPISLADSSGIVMRSCIRDIALSIQNRLAETR